MQVSWELTARSFFDQLSKRDQAAVERSVLRVAENWEQLEPTHLKQVIGVSNESGRPLMVLRVGGDLRVLLYRIDQRVVVLDVVRRSQIERLQARSRS
jgi:mRNA-degrading endonuclease RelE of RelBE toxin-antitoxin system